MHGGDFLQEVCVTVKQDWKVKLSLLREQIQVLAKKRLEIWQGEVSLHKRIPYLEMYTRVDTLFTFNQTLHPRGCILQLHITYIALKHVKQTFLHLHEEVSIFLIQ